MVARAPNLQTQQQPQPHTHRTGNLILVEAFVTCFILGPTHAITLVTHALAAVVTSIDYSILVWFVANATRS